jgi:hypothetical protein
MQRTMVMVIYQSEQGNSFRTGTENDKVERLESQGDEIIIFFFFFSENKVFKDFISIRSWVIFPI